MGSTRMQINSPSAERNGRAAGEEERLLKAPQPMQEPRNVVRHLGDDLFVEFPHECVDGFVYGSLDEFIALQPRVQVDGLVRVPWPLARAELPPHLGELNPPAATAETVGPNRPHLFATYTGAFWMPAQIVGRSS